MSCEECRHAYKLRPRWDTKADIERKKDGPPCETCRPETLPGNVEALSVWSRCQGQLIMGFNGPVDINILAVMGLMDRLGIPLEDQDALLLKVQMLAGIVLSERARAREEEQANKQGA